MTIVAITVGIIAFAMLIMAVGVMVKGKCLRGSCGGPKVTGANGELICGACGRREQTTERRETPVPTGTRE